MKTKIELLKELDFEMEHNKVLVTHLYKFRRRDFSEEELIYNIETTRNDNANMKKFMRENYNSDNLSDEEWDSYEIYNDPDRVARRKEDAKRRKN